MDPDEYVFEEKLLRERERQARLYGGSDEAPPPAARPFVEVEFEMRKYPGRVELESRNCFYAAFFAVTVSNCYGEGEMTPELMVHPSMWVADHVVHTKVYGRRV